MFCCFLSCLDLIGGCFGLPSSVFDTREQGNAKARAVPHMASIKEFWIVSRRSLFGGGGLEFWMRHCAIEGIALSLVLTSVRFGLGVLGSKAVAKMTGIKTTLQ
jgi:hypothetical protein